MTDRPQKPPPEALSENSSSALFRDYHTLLAGDANQLATQHPLTPSEMISLTAETNKFNEAFARDLKNGTLDLSDPQLRQMLADNEQNISQVTQYMATKGTQLGTALSNAEMSMQGILPNPQFNLHD